MIQHGCPRISVKKLRIIQDKRDSEDVKEQRNIYIQHFNEEERRGALIIYIDESPWVIMQTRKKGRSPVGQRSYQMRRKVQSQHISAISAICAEYGVLHVMFCIGEVDNEVFQLFLTEVFKRIRECIEDDDATIVMDNVKFHKHKDVKQLIANAGYTILLTATNSCELMPIEYVFSIWKAGINIPPEVTSIETTINFLADSFKQISAQTVRRCVKYVTHYLFGKASNRESLLLVDTLRDFAAEAHQIAQVVLDPNDDEDFVRAVALSLGLQINEHILGDGNCFFNAIFDITKDKSPDQYRNEVVIKLQEEPNKYFKFIDSPEARAKYINKVKTNGVFAGEIEYRALCDVLGQPIIIHDVRYGREGYMFGSEYENVKQPLHVGLVNFNHYWSMKRQQ
ncbi:MAG: hypothetical protein EZS28_021289 [Streblomastix strix]|uniref:OTU domain-containing protein n=1 Tax=Streblomastix strix TaxID=222440 RepID=A0A5J4VL07_9EUKA|nr:MAG: hypothetical protein EZS28_021289 [Streblomastix strix]